MTKIWVTTESLRSKKRWLALFSWFPNMVIQYAWLLCRPQAGRDSPSYDLLSFRREVVQALKVSTTNSQLCLQPWLFLACVVCRDRLWAIGACFVFNFTLDNEAYASNQSVVATYGYIDFRAYCTLLGCICVLDHIKMNKQKIEIIGIYALFAVKQQKIENSTK